MDIDGRVVVVTGGASGIGRSLCLAFAAERARGVVVADLDGDGASAVAGEVEQSGVPAVGVVCDASDEGAVQQLVRTAEAEFGPVDVFCANAGILVTGGIETPTDAWDKAWAVNVKSHLFAARAVVPNMVERGEGYLVHTASAAGLLTQLGAAPYSVTKHAVVALAEWLSITYGDAGLRVSCVCPQSVATNLGATSRAMLTGRPLAARAPQPAPAQRPTGPGHAGSDGVLSADEVAAAVIEAMHDERFLVLPHPQVETYEKRRADDRERWLRGMRRAQARLSAPRGGVR